MAENKKNISTDKRKKVSNALRENLKRRKAASKDNEPQKTTVTKQ